MASTNRTHDAETASGRPAGPIAGVHGDAAVNQPIENAMTPTEEGRRGEATERDDDELARAILAALRDRHSPSGVHDLLEIAREAGVEQGHQAARVARRLIDQGYVEDLGSSGDSILGAITVRGAESLADGQVEDLSGRAVEDLELGGRTADAQGRPPRTSADD